jgi:hypothetical protein
MSKFSYDSSASSHASPRQPAPPLLLPCGPPPLPDWRIPWPERGLRVEAARGAGPQLLAAFQLLAQTPTKLVAAKVQVADRLAQGPIRADPGGGGQGLGLLRIHGADDEAGGGQLRGGDGERRGTAGVGGARPGGGLRRDTWRAHRKVSNCHSRMRNCTTNQATVAEERIRLRAAGPTNSLRKLGRGLTSCFKATTSQSIQRHNIDDYAGNYII